MPEYAEVNGDTLVQYPYNYDTLQRANPHTNFKPNRDLATLYNGTEAHLAGNNLVVVQTPDQPDYDVNSQVCELLPNLILQDGAWTKQWSVTAMTAEQITRVQTQTQEGNRTKALQQLRDSDWVELPSVTDTTSMPHLLNLSDFITYRQQLRAIVVNPPVTSIELPTKPMAQWSTV